MAEKKQEIKKQPYVPMHLRLQENQQLMQELDAKQEELKILFRSVFETKEGQRLLDYWTQKYIGVVPHSKATANEIIFMHGNSYIVHEIFKNLRQEK